MNPLLLPFPGYPQWRLFFCPHWLELMPDGQPQLPQHIEAAVTIEAPRPGAAVGCRACDSIWVMDRTGTWSRRSLANVRMTGAERRMRWDEGMANEHLDAAAAAGDTEFDS